MLILTIVLSVGMGMAVAMLGGGGSIITVPILVYVLGVEPKSALATALLVVMSIGLFSTIMHARAGNVQWATAFLFGPVAMVGAFSGGLIAKYIPAGVLLVLFTGMMIVTALAMLRPAGQRPPPRQPGSVPLRYALVVVQGLGVGLATGLVGAGGGFLIVPVLVLLGGLTMHKAVGTALPVIVMNATASFLGYLSHEVIDYRLAALVVSAAMAGALIGVRLAGRMPQRALRTAFAALILVTGALMLYHELSWAMLKPIIAAPWQYWAIGVALVAIAIATLRFILSSGSASRPVPLVPEGEEPERPQRR